MPLPYPTNPNLQAVPVYQPGRPIEEVARELGLPADGIIKVALCRVGSGCLSINPYAHSPFRKATLFRYRRLG
jgi:hypothetical protein